MSFDSKQKNLLKQFVDESNCKIEESTFLNSSTVPTYEEFTKKTNVINSPVLNKYFNSTQVSTTNLVTDDESDEETFIKNEPIKNQFLELVKTNSKNLIEKPNKIINTNSSNNLLKTVLTPQKNLILPKTPINNNSLNKTPKSTKKIIFQCDDSTDEYVIYTNKDVQTSFNLSLNSDKNEKENSKNFIIDDSIIELNTSSCNKNNSKPDLNSYRDNSNTKDLHLHLSSSSTTDSDSDNISDLNFKRKLLALSPKFKKMSIDIRKENNVTVRKKNQNRSTLGNKSKNSKKRVSICGQALSDDVFNIDDTVIDQFDNELDHQKGILFNIDETNILDGNFDNNNKRSTCILSSTKILLDKTNKNKIESENKLNNQEKPPKDSSSDNDDAFERFLNQYKPKSNEENKLITKKDLSEFIVEDSIIEEEDELSEEADDKNYKLNDIKKKNNKKLIESKIKNLQTINSSTSSDNLDQSDESDDKEYDEQYDKDLQLFYIRTTNKLIDLKDKNSKDINQIKNNKNDKNESAITFNDSTSSESSKLNSLSRSSSESSLESSFRNSSSDSDNEDSFSKLFRKNIDFKNKPVFQEDRNSFKTPSKNPINKERDQRLVKTQFIPRHERIKKLSFIESLSKHIEDERLRDPSVEYYIKKFHLKNVKYELLNECFKLFNKHAFDNQLPQNMKLVWSDKITSTAGYCKYSSRDLSCEIHISTKVCTDPERVRDTLAHEMCHAAAFLVSRCNDNHGPIWKSWTRKVNFTFKKIPQITVTHSYSVTKKFIFKCQNCHLEIHRFSKSINIEKEVCGICHGRFEIIKNTKKNMEEMERLKKDRYNTQFDNIRDGYDFNQESFGVKQFNFENKLATPRQPNKFALYVKENYGSVKKEKNLSNHKDVMQELSKNFKLLSTK